MKLRIKMVIIINPNCSNTFEFYVVLWYRLMMSTKCGFQKT